MLENFLYAVFGSLIAALGFFVRRRIEQKPMFEQIDKQQRLLDLKKNLEASSTTLDDLKVLEDTIMGKANSAKSLAAAYQEQAVQIYATDHSENMTQADMNRHAAASFDRAEERLVALVEDLRRHLSGGSLDAFENSQQAWLRYREASAEFQSSQYEGGSIQPLIHASALESVTISRIVEIEPLLKDLQTK